MAQLTIRADEDLVDRIRKWARAEGKSMNSYVTSVLDAATDPELATPEANRTRERLRKAGILWEPDPSQRVGTRPDPKLLAEARKAFGKGKPLSDYVIEGRGPR